MKCTDTDHADSVFAVHIFIQTEKLFKSHVHNIEVGDNQSVNDARDRKPLEHFRFRTIRLNVTRKREKNFVEKLSGDRTGSISSEHLTHTEIKDEVFYRTFKKIDRLKSPGPTCSNMPSSFIILRVKNPSQINYYEKYKTREFWNFTDCIM